MTDSKTPQFVDLDNARSDDQRRVMADIIAAGHCPFCWENFQQHHQQPIEKRGRFWLVTKNQWPYNFTKHHYLIIALPHWEHLADVTPEAAAELFQLCGELEKDLHVPGGGIAMRFGDTNYSAGTVKHLHVQFLVPNIDADGFTPIRVKIGKEKEKR